MGMKTLSATHSSLLVRMRDGDDGTAWGQFVDICAPVVWAFARKQGLEDADAAEVTQEVLGKVSRGIRRLDATLGPDAKVSLRAYLFVVVYRELRRWSQRQTAKG